MKKNRIDVITLGCSKNLVDSERLLKRFKDLGYEVAHDSDNVEGEIVVINTCGFIGDAKEESINTILQFCDAKKHKKIKRLYVMGCLSQRYFDDLNTEIPEVDKFYGKFDWENLISDLELTKPSTAIYDRVITTPSHHAYIKISEGCNRFCAFCAIPLITGRHKSRPIDEIIAEVKMLVQRGVKEFNVIAQDLSSYGLDIDGTLKLPELIDSMAQIPGVKWIRLHYAYPAQFPYEILKVMRKHENVCKYLDIALQHISTKVLSNMRRHIDKEETYALLQKIRSEVPGINIRTTLMVGFPGEGEAEFEELKEFVKKARFERMGAFAYSEEDGTFAAQHYEDTIPDDIKQSRLDEIMALQQEISAEINESKVGKTLVAVIDREEDEYYVGRTEFDSPEVDPEVLISKERELKIGEFYKVEITEAMPYDLIGKIVE
ncbi:MAG: 30S ribosomal protein S12 methylthiotransferase RimO [Bacteroidales bacterium]|nr:30S ribosomal protein S12 methylthiotransferase RimO [Muribaculaceae bacterium]MDD6006146.1 30S ribosomal protein S12 methylthiotransferase RimO [Bacteroidales bacterium]MDD6852349.1 30S ribosomal protein S12 methylthiotransferase RimO [Bacteroidales bacterium]MDD7404680.1 30S ribosomal protein S12 methylthiotransferase RimO [Bacteroidales bacterium]MDY2931709.1 30S ribosomal protein S12 methylthiotransferase RimO [Muribaculaceae bacterium]